MATSCVGRQRDTVDALRFDALFDSRQLRALTVGDALAREALAIDADQCIKGEKVVVAPWSRSGDTVPEFVSMALDRWAHENGVTLDFSRPYRPTDNGFMESLQRPPAGRMPHPSLGWPTPVE